MPYNSVTVTTTPTLIVSPETRRRSLHLVNMDEGKIVYIGPDDNITTSNAIPLYETQTRDQSRIPEGYQGPIYGIVSSGTADVRYWEHIL